MKPGIGRSVALAAAAAGAAMLLAWLWMSHGPLAPIKVTVGKPARGALVASSFGIGTVEARRSYALGPIVASRVSRVLVDQGDAVRAGQLLAELDPVDLDERLASGQIAAERAARAMAAAEAQLADARSRQQLAEASERRYAELRVRGFVSQEAADAKHHEANSAGAGAAAAAAQFAAAQRDHARALADASGIGKLRAQARLRSPVDGVVSARLVEPGTTVIAGQAVLQIIDPDSLWIRARIDQGQAGGVRVGQPAEIALRSMPNSAHRGQVQRVDWVSDAVSEERIVNVSFAARPEGVSVGELVEVTIRVAEVPDALFVPAAAVRRVDRREGVWRMRGARIEFLPAKFGITTLDGRTQILDGVEAGTELVVHSEQALGPNVAVRVVPDITAHGQ